MSHKARCCMCPWKTRAITEQIVFTGEFLDNAAGVTVERPNTPQDYDMTGRRGSIVTVAGMGRFVIIRQLPESQWLASRLT